MKTCIYCGNSDGLTYEHIIPAAIGGRAKIKGVCRKCNNGLLSSLDKELCSRSALSIIAAQELKDKKISQLWGTDAENEGLLVEGGYDPEIDGLRILPQLIFDSDVFRGTHIRGDPEEIDAFGVNNFQGLFFRQIINAFREYNFEGKKRKLILEKVNSTFFSENQRFPARIFTQCSINELEKGSTPILRYLTDDDLKRAFNILANWSVEKRFKKFRLQPTTGSAGFLVIFDQMAVSRALIKIAINLLAYSLNKTSVDRRYFLDAAKVVTSEVRGGPFVTRNNGFVVPHKLESIAKVDAHVFWLVHRDGWWRGYFSFFGGRICAKCQFPGPNWDDRDAIEIVSPISQGDLTVNHRLIVPELSASVEWDLEGVIPSVKLNRIKSGELLVRRKRVR